MYTSRSDDDNGKKSSDDAKSGLSVKAIIWIVVAIVAVVWIVQNTSDAAVQFLFWDFTIPLWLLILIAMAVGALLGYFLPKLLNRGDD